MLTKKQKKSLKLIIISGILYAVCALVPFEKFGEHHNIIELLCYFVPYIICGFAVLKKAVFNIFSGRLFDENFLMAVATIGALVLSAISGHDSAGEAHAHSGAGEAAMVVILYRIGTLFESIAAEKSRRSINGLMNIMPDFANVERNGEMITLDPLEVEVGETIVIKPGERIPLDGKIVDGSSSLNTSALTGESTPLNVTNGDRVISGAINLTGLLRVETESRYENSTVGKVLELIENATTKKAKTENFISRFASVYTPVVVVCALIIGILPPLLGWLSAVESLHRALTFLVVSCPCALVISVPLSFFGGMGAASRQGILIKGATHLEAFSKIKLCLFDKTGTLTNGSFKVTAIHPEKITEAELLRIAAAAESYSDHPLSVSLVAAYGRVPDLKAEKATELAGAGIKAEINGDTVLVGNEKLMKLEKINIAECSECHLHHHGASTVHIAVNGDYMGHIVMSDQIKPGVKELISFLKKRGIEPIMVSGDKPDAANLVANEIGIDSVYASLLPQGKVDIVQKLMSQNGEKGNLAFVGDGINDAPVLITADVGISMGAMGSDAAIEAADIVIMDDSISKISLAKKIASRTMAIVRENIVFAIGIKVLVLIFGAFTEVPMWLAIFADVGVTVIATLNAARAMSLGLSKNNRRLR